MKITRVGHACVLIEGSRTILVDPFIKDNPSAALSIDQIPKLDFIAVTHDHFDHFTSEVIELAKRDGAEIVGIYEVATRQDIANSGAKATGMNIGGTYKTDGVSFGMTPAVHSAEHGNPAGFVITMDGKSVYHAGDTTYFSDMGLIPEMFGHIDVALLPIGGHFTMDINGAARAVKALKPDVTIPIHYNTWPPIQADTAAFEKACNGAKVVVLDPGESYEL